MKNHLQTLVFAAIAAGIWPTAAAPKPAAGQDHVPIWRWVPGYETMDPLDEDGYVIPREAIPETQDGRPDFTGVWAGPGFGGAIGRYDTDAGFGQGGPRANLDPDLWPPFEPGGETFMFRYNVGDLRVDDPVALCFPDGMPREAFTFYPQQWIQTPKHVVVINEFMHWPRVIPLGSPNRPHDPDVGLTYMGDSIGWWEGDTLVIDTIGLREWPFDSSHEPARWHSDELHLVERLRYTDPMMVSYEMTFDDPVIWTRPWKQQFQMTLHPTWKILEYVCQENDRCSAGNCTPSDVQLD
jgi:hypothetical protein